MEVCLRVLVQSHQIPVALQKGTHFIHKEIIYNSSLLGPADEGFLRAAAIVAGSIIGNPSLHRHIAPGGIVRKMFKGEVVTGGDLGALAAAVVLPGGIGLEIADFRQPVLLLLELEFQLLNG